jgi:hypothetical protein
MSKHDALPLFNHDVGDSIGRGKDNVVVPFKGIGTVLKWNHDKGKKKAKQEEITQEEHFNRLLYKKKKYEMLKFFLRDFVPKSDFVLGNKLDGKKIKIKEYTVQKRVPNITITSLSSEQKSDPRLIHNIHLFIQKLRMMYKIIKQVNDSVEEGKLDVKLDLGGLSKSVEKEVREGKIFDFESMNKDFMGSRNLLVDPESMQLSCVDFDVGEWSEAKEATLILVKALTHQNKEAMELIEKPQI